VLKFFDWAYANGDQLALSLDYIPMPDAVVELIHAEWKEQVKDVNGKPIW
jgi:phosphate transport system substrate-binding protein